MYSDNEVVMAKINLHVFIIKNIANSDVTGNDTSYSLTAKKNYESYVQRLKYLVKKFVNDTMSYLAQWKKNNNYGKRWLVEIYFRG